MVASALNVPLLIGGGLAAGLGVNPITRLSGFAAIAVGVAGILGGPGAPGGDVTLPGTDSANPDAIKGDIISPVGSASVSLLSSTYPMQVQYRNVGANTWTVSPFVSQSINPFIGSESQLPDHPFPPITLGPGEVKNVIYDVPLDHTPFIGATLVTAVIKWNSTIGVRFLDTAVFSLSASL